MPPFAAAPASYQADLLCRYWGGKPVFKRTWPYDMWSLGVVWLELVLATPHIFQISSRTASLLQRQLHNKPQVYSYSLIPAASLLMQHFIILLASPINDNSAAANAANNRHVHNLVM